MSQQQTTQRYAVRITTVDPTQGLIEAATKDGTGIEISTIQFPDIFRWPLPGEGWIVIKKNGSWYLESYFPNDLNTWQSIEEGDAIITSPTGKIQVVTDGGSGIPFSIDADNFITQGFVTNSGAAAASTGTSTTTQPLTILPTLGIPVHNPSGAHVLLSGGWSCYSTVVATSVAWYYQLDFGAFTQIDGFLFNAANQHMKTALFSTIIGPLTTGTHEIGFGYRVASGGSITFDSNDTYSLSIQEMTS